MVHGDWVPGPGRSRDGGRSGPGPAGCAVDAITRHRIALLDLDADTVRELPARQRADTVYRRLIERVPVENLSDQRACRERPWRPEAWPRGTDRFLRENHRAGLGGRSFTLTYALADLFRGLGIAAQSVLGRNLVTEETHAAVVVRLGAPTPLLYDPALLASGPIPVAPGEVHEEPLGSVRLEPHVGKTFVVVLRTPAYPEDRPIYAFDPSPVPPNRFRQAWVASFCRGRVEPIRLVRRVGDEIRRWSEGDGGRLEVLRVDGRERRPLSAVEVDTLHAVFGIDEGCLRTFLTERG